MWNPCTLLKANFFVWEVVCGKDFNAGSSQKEGWTLPSRCNMCIRGAE